MTSGLIFSDISDHLPIFTLLRHSESHDSNLSIKLSRRLINSNAKEKFNKELTDCDWENVFNSNDPNTAYEYFITSYKAIYEKCFHLKQYPEEKLNYLPNLGSPRDFKNQLKPRVDYIRLSLNIHHQ